MTDVSVVIVNYNTKDYLLQCLKSVVAGNKVDARNIFVIDNGSADESAEAVRQIYPTVNLIVNPHNTGFAFAVNQGLRQAAQFKYHLIVNTDALLAEGYIDTMAGFMARNAKAGIVTGQLLNKDGSLQRSFDNIPSLLNELLGKSLSQLVAPLTKQGHVGYFTVESVIGAAMMVSQKAIESVGLLDEQYFLFLEETDWCLRMPRKGWQVCFLPQATAYHLQGQSKKSVYAPARIEYLNSMYKFFRKNYPRPVYYVYRALKPVRIALGLAVNLLACILTLGLAAGPRRTLVNYAILLWWHLRRCPEEMTLGYISKNPDIAAAAK